MLTLYWVPPTEGAPPPRLKIWNETGAIVLPAANKVPDSPYWSFEVADISKNKQWISNCDKNSGWSLTDPRVKKTKIKPPEPEPEPEPKMEIQEPPPPPPQRKRYRAAKRNIIAERSVG